MSELPEPTAIPNEKLTPIAEFRRWLVMAFVLAVVGGCMALVLPRFVPRDMGDIAMLVFWLVFTGCEGWVQFDNATRRIAWPAAGCLTALALILSRPRTPSLALFCLIPAFLEFLTARRVRRRPWVWLIATPTIYGSAEIWAERVASATRQVTSWVSNSVDLPLTINTQVAELAAIFSVILMTRAIVGSFVAPRKRGIRPHSVS